MVVSFISLIALSSQGGKFTLDSQSLLQRSLDFHQPFEDVLLTLKDRASNNLAFHVGYRIIEGGADNDDVYNFSLLNSLAVGATWTF